MRRSGGRDRPRCRSRGGARAGPGRRLWRELLRPLDRFQHSFGSRRCPRRLAHRAGTVTKGLRAYKERQPRRRVRRAERRDGEAARTRGAAARCSRGRGSEPPARASEHRLHLERELGRWHGRRHILHLRVNVKLAAVRGHEEQRRHDRRFADAVNPIPRGSRGSSRSASKRSDMQRHFLADPVGRRYAPRGHTRDEDEGTRASCRARACAAIV